MTTNTVTIERSQRPKPRIWRYDATEPKERRPWIVSVPDPAPTNGDDPMIHHDFEEFDHAVEFLNGEGPTP